MRDFTFANNSAIRDIAELVKWKSFFEDYIKKLSCDGAHDVGHLRRVWANFLKLSHEMEDVCLLTGISACYLHDCISTPKDSPNRTTASLRAAEEAIKLLQGAGFPAVKLENVFHCIEAHSYSANIEAKTVEAKLLSDADKLDALGNIGLARLFYTAGSIGSQLFYADEPIPINRSNSEKEFAVDHYFKKLKSLHLRMYTSNGILEAKRRIKIMDSFIDDLVT